MIGRDVPAPVVDRRVRAAAEATDSRVTLLSIQQSLGGSRGLRFFVLSDSGEEREVPSQPRIADRAVESRKVTSGFAIVRGDEVGQVAQPIDYRGEPGWVVLYSRDLGDVSETVSSVRERVLVATGIALLIALIGGYLVAQALSRRVRRLERSVHEVAAGRFRESLPVDSEDELGQLTRAFNEMQEQLRQVDVARKEFIATASHELRTPIFSLAGFVELLQDEDLDESTRREFLETMNEQVARLQKLSVDLLDLSRLDAGSPRARARGGGPVRARPLDRRRVQARADRARHGAPGGAAGGRRLGHLRRGTGGADHAYPARQRAPAHAEGQRSP